MARRPSNPPGNVADMRINDLLREAQTFVTTNLRSALTAAEDALRLARAHAMEAPAAQALHIIARAQVIRGKSQQALDAGMESCKLYRSLGNRAGEAAALITTATCYRRLELFNEARAMLQESIAITTHDTLSDIRTEALCGLGYVEMADNDIDAARRYFHQSIEEGKAAGAQSVVAIALQGMGISHYLTCEWRKAIEWYEQALAVAEPTRNLLIITHVRCNMTVSLILLGEIAEALRLERRNLRALEQLDDQRNLRISLNSIAAAARSLGEYDTALSALIRSLAIAEQINDRRGTAVVLNNLGELYVILGDRYTGLEHFMRGYAIAQEINDRQLQVMMLEHIAENHRRLGRGSSALVHALHALRLARLMHDTFGEQKILNTLGLLHLERNSLDEADACLRPGLSLARSTSTPELESRILMTMASVAIRRNQLPEARNYLEQAYQVASERHHKELRHELLQRLADICEQIGDHERSVRYHHDFQRSTATIFSDKRVHRIRRRVAEFEFQAHQKEAMHLNRHEMEAARRMAGEELEKRLWKLQQNAGITPPENTLQNAEMTDRVTPDENPGNPVSQAVPYRVEALGSLRLWANGTEITGRSWGRKRARDLFKLLLLRYRRPVTIDEIIELLWDGNTAPGTELLVMNTISHLRRVLEPDRRPHAPSQVIPGINRTYMLDLGDNAVIDILQFKEAITQARQHPGADEQYRHYQQAIALYGDDLLKEDYYAEWTAAERELLKDDYLAALESVGNHALRLGQTDTALSTARSLLTTDSTCIEGYRIMIAALRNQGREREITILHEQCRDVFEREYGARWHVHISKLFSREAAA